MRLAERYCLSVYDAMIAAAALTAECDTLYSEDMHDGLVIDGRVRIVNPFAPVAEIAIGRDSASARRRSRLIARNRAGNAGGGAWPCPSVRRRSRGRAVPVLRATSDPARGVEMALRPASTK